MALSNRLGKLNGKRMKNPAEFRMEKGRVMRRRAIWMGYTLHKWTYEIAPLVDARAVLFGKQNLIAEGWFNG